jgi:hypothetical protein
MRNALRFGAGAALGLLLWLFATPAYNRVLATAAGVIRIDPRFRDVRLAAAGRVIEVRRPAMPAQSVPADQLTYNIALLLGLFATNARIFTDRNMRPLFVSLLILAATHWLALVVTIESGHAQRLGEWSEAHYSRGEAYVWALGEYFYRLVGMFAIAFACWWLSSDGSAPAAGHRRGSRKRPAPR